MIRFWYCSWDPSCRSSCVTPAQTFLTAFFNARYPLESNPRRMAANACFKVSLTWVCPTSLRLNHRNPTSSSILSTLTWVSRFRWPSTPFGVATRRAVISLAYLPILQPYWGLRVTSMASSGHNVLSRKHRRSEPMLLVGASRSGAGSASLRVFLFAGYPLLRGQLCGQRLGNTMKCTGFAFP